MKSFTSCPYVLVVFLLITPFLAPRSHAEVHRREDFITLKDWEPFSFKKIEKHTKYETQNSLLKVTSAQSASAIITREVFSSKDFPILEWRWKVDNILQGADARSKATDDFPLRIMVVFEYDPDKKSWFGRRKYEAFKLIFDRYPPHNALSYVWANNEWDRPIMENPYSSDSMMISLVHGESFTGQWNTQRRNIIDDYKQAFADEEMPEFAKLAIISDSDDTGGEVTAWLDFLEIRSE